MKEPFFLFSFNTFELVIFLLLLFYRKPSSLRISLRSKKRYNRTEDTLNESVEEQDFSSEKSSSGKKLKLITDE